MPARKTTSTMKPYQGSVLTVTTSTAEENIDSTSVARGPIRSVRLPPSSMPTTAPAPYAASAQPARLSEYPSCTR